MELLGFSHVLARSLTFHWCFSGQSLCMVQESWQLLDDAKEAKREGSNALFLILGNLSLIESWKGWVTLF